MISNDQQIKELTEILVGNDKPYENSVNIAGLVTNWLAIAIFTEKCVVKWCTNGFARMLNKPISEVQGKSYLEIDSVLLAKSTAIVDNILIPLAKAEGYSVGTYWLEDPKTKELSRCALAFIALPNDEIGVTALMLDDSTNGFFTKKVSEGYADREGNVYTEEELEIVDLFLAGHSYEFIAEQLNSSAPIVRRRLNKLARRFNVKTPAEIRGVIWGRAAEDVLISQESVLTGHHYLFPKT